MLINMLNLYKLILHLIFTSNSIQKYSKLLLRHKILIIMLNYQKILDQNMINVFYRY